MEQKIEKTRDINSIRALFPVTQKYIYLDHAGVAPVSNVAADSVNEFLREATHDGVFKYGSWTRRVEKARRRCARLIGAELNDVCFVKNTSHGLSIVASGLDWKEGDNVLIVEGEFPANVYPWLSLEKKGVEVRTIPLHGTEIRLDDIERLMDSRTRLLSISSVQYWSGFRVDLEAVGRLCGRKGVRLFVDAIQSLGVVPMDVKEFGIDFLAADGHKWLLAPEGTGIFYCAPELAAEIDPPLVGWKSVVNESDYENIDFRLKPTALKFEEGSFNFMGITALGATVNLLLEFGIENVYDRVLGLGDLVIAEAEKRGMSVVTLKERERRAGIVTIAGGFDPEPVRDDLKSMGVMVNVRGGGLRVSPHFYNTEDDIKGFFDALDGVLKTAG
ncbi:MAG: aminotransferase class V-fold PLP-dependent enzyme [Candidatus Dadabacteria bacterium]|nr:aminotransferase class V-fold PLP-dependent enzyme [Candidatus Dadabacteria bacterium]